jgi:hypothetical protein
MADGRPAEIYRLRYRNFLSAPTCRGYVAVMTANCDRMTRLLGKALKVS